MLNAFLQILEFIVKAILFLSIPVLVILILFYLICLCWMVYFRIKENKPFPKPRSFRRRGEPLYRQLLFSLPRRYVLDQLDRDPDYFVPHGIHMFCGEQGCGKTMSCVEMMLRLQKAYPKSKMISNFDVISQDEDLTDWRQLLTYTNGHFGVIVGIDEIQNWFMSGKNQLPPEMLEVATQNRKNNRILCCTAQVFTRVSKGLREQVTLVYEPHTFLGAFTVVFIRKPVFDSEGNVLQRKWRGMYCFTHTDELRQAYDTYKVIHTLAKDGFKDPVPQAVTNVIVQTDAKRK